MTLLTALREEFRRSLRVRLLALALLPILVAVPLVIFILAGWGTVYFNRLLITKVHSDLAVAHGYFEQVKDGVGNRVDALAGSERLARLLRGRPDAGALDALLRGERKRLGVDYLILVGADGRVVAGSNGVSSGAYDGGETLRRALSGRADTEVDILSAEQLSAIDPALAARARTPLIATRNAAPSNRSEETRGMVIRAAAPLTANAAVPGGALVGGLLLNRNLAFVDRINAIVYPQGSLPLGSVGTATLFLDDVRIATNVRLFEDGSGGGNERAIGTRVSAVVRHTVLDEGRTWLDRAFVVNDWYVSAYEPIVDGEGARCGMLYVGFLESPFAQARTRALALAIFLFVLAVAGAALVSVRLARHVSQPVERMHETMTAIENGIGEARVGPVGGEDELARLSAHLDSLLDRLAQQTEALQRWGTELDAKVADRTRELAAANDSLRSAQQRLVMSEKLAAIGQLAAGVAHEINNPVAVIQGNLELLRDSLGEAATPVQGEIRLIQDQVFRIRMIVTKLLQFARPTEFVGFMEPVRLDQVVEDSLVLVAHQLKKSQVEVVKALHAGVPVTVNRNELQQVLINLIVNALQAMPEGGTLRLATGDLTKDGVAGGYVAVADTGRGISDEDRARLFDPFFTTKRDEGTGLGLWVSLGLVQRYGGSIEVATPPEGGSVFTVWLPNEAGGQLGLSPRRAP